uniref:Uncharacterized protein n=1 Tax=Elaeophora elaphi TaxID=1147741 RepID=A0A0R3RVW6_9BILA
MNQALPNAISPFLQKFDNGEKEEKPISVKPKLRRKTAEQTITTASTTAIAVTSLITQPILLSRISPGSEMDEAKQARIQVRYLGITKNDT